MLSEITLMVTVMIVTIMMMRMMSFADAGADVDCDSVVFWLFFFVIPGTVHLCFVTRIIIDSTFSLDALRAQFYAGDTHQSG